MGIKKSEVETVINSGNPVEALNVIKEYESEFPADADILSMKTAYYLSVNDPEEALKYAEQGVRRLPLNGEMQYNLAVVYEALGKLFEAYVCYFRAYFIFEYTKDERQSELLPKKSANRVIGIIVEYINSPDTPEEEKNYAIERLHDFERMEENNFGLYEKSFRDARIPLIGKWYYDGMHSRKYVGIFKDQYFNSQIEFERKDLVSIKGEFLEGTKKRDILIKEEGEYIVPIASEELNVLRFNEKDNLYTVVQSNPYRFSYYRVSGNTEIHSDKECIFGKPIPLKKDPERKSLVLSIFVDGLSYSILKNETDFKRIMPYTYDYFVKGTIFENAYNTGEWTYPSIASYVTGLDTTHHMLFHHTLDYPMPEDIPTIAEYFKAEGYYTSKYCGNWRIIPSYGHSRGYDRFVYQHQLVGFKVHEVVSDVINQINAGKETDQYIWMSIGDLHDIADKVELPLSVQKDIPVSNRIYHQKGSTSVKSGYNADDKLMYIRTASYIDMWLHILFNYIEENYSEDEVVVSLFSDHGQGFLIDRTDAHFLGGYRSNVPMMFRGGEADGNGFCEEIVSALDYSSILRKISGNKQKSVPVDGHLPEIFGGNGRRKYAYTESIHPGDPYQAALFLDDGSAFYFSNSEPVMNDGRFYLREYKYYLENKKGELIVDSLKEEKLLNLVLEHIAPILVYD